MTYLVHKRILLCLVYCLSFFLTSSAYADYDTYNYSDEIMVPADRLLSANEIKTLAQEDGAGNLVDLLKEDPADKSVFYTLNVLAIGIEQGLDTAGISDEVLSRYRAQLLTFANFDFRTAILEEDYSPQLKVLLLDIMLAVPPILRVRGLSDEDILSLTSDPNLAVAALNSVSDTSAVPEDLLLDLIDQKEEASPMALRIYTENNPEEAMDKLEELIRDGRRLARNAVTLLATVYYGCEDDPVMEERIFSIMEETLEKSRKKKLPDACAGVLTEIGGRRSAELVKKYSDKISDAYIGYFIAHNPEEAQVVGLS